MSINIISVADTKDYELLGNKNIEKYGEILLLQQKNQLNLLVGFKKENITYEDIRYLGGICRKKVKDLTVQQVSFELTSLVETISSISEKQLISLFMEGWYSAEYQFLTYKQDMEDDELQIEFKDSTYEKQAWSAKVRVNAMNTARDLCNEPANKLTPAIYADKLIGIFTETEVAVDIIEGERLQEMNFHAVDIVGKGSGRPPKLAVLTLDRNPSAKKVALVGKGVTFDSGGINAKTGSDIGEMKMDMGGSAAVVGAMKLLADTNADVNAMAILPLVENVADGNAFLPSDVITYRNGLTVEVGNTDAEGRLVLADGILYAEELGAETIIDIATLTGTIGQALGLKVAGIFSNHEDELWQYKELGELTGDFVWPMPVIDDYKDYLKSDTADLNNMSSSSFGGAVTAALFLKQFVSANKKWIHIDMANTVRPWKKTGYYADGASGFGVRLLTELVCHESK